jgi:DNA replication licensing factor MCM2
MRCCTHSLLQEIPLEQLSDIKAKSIVEWIANDRVRRSIIRHFRQFLMTYVDEHGASVYGQRIRNLGESECISLDDSSNF